MRLQQLVEDVVGPLNRLLLGNTGLFQQVGLNVTTAKLASSVEVNPDEFTKPGRVVVPGGLGVTIRLQYGVGSHNLVLKGYLLGVSSSFFLWGSNSSQVGDNLLGVLSFSSTRLTSDQHRLVLVISQHVTIGSLCDGPQVRRHFILPLTKVQLDDSSSVDGVPFVRVHHNTEETRVGVDEFGNKTDFQVPEDRGVIQESQVSHVFTLLKLGWVDLSNLRGLESFFLEFVKI
jgi:hypothetical protein